MVDEISDFTQEPDCEFNSEATLFPPSTKCACPEENDLLVPRVIG
jgi:hypothetical protein